MCCAEFPPTHGAQTFGLNAQVDVSAGSAAQGMEVALFVAEPLALATAVGISTAPAQIEPQQAVSICAAPAAPIDVGTSVPSMPYEVSLDL